MTPREPRSWRRRLAVAAVAALATLVAGVLGLELFFRSVLFTDGWVARQWGWRFRNPTLFADVRQGPHYWKMLKLLHWSTEERLNPEQSFDPLLGWHSSLFEAETYRHRAEGHLGERRPLLLYGDSFAACVTPPKECFQGILARSPLGEELALVNFGVLGYGLDQMHLLMTRTLDHFADRDPIVVVAIFVDGDLERAMSPVTNYAKPFFRLGPDGLALDPPASGSWEDYLDAHPLATRSYVWDWLTHGSTLLSARAKRRLIERKAWVREAKRLNRALIEAMQQELESRGLSFFFLIFNGRESLGAGRLAGWKEPFLHHTFEELGIPFVSTRPEFVRFRQRTGQPFVDLFANDPGRGHYGANGNELAFEALVRGLEGHFQAYGEVTVLD